MAATSVTFGTRAAVCAFSLLMTNDQDRDNDERVIAVGFLTRREVAMVGAHLSRLYPLDDAGPFADLIEAIDEADQEYHRSENVRSC